MVDFKKKLGKRILPNPVDPIEIYDTLDRASDKGPLRTAQEKILGNWHNNYRNKRDVILKLHTGQGKTLIGLLILQSKINEEVVPALYLCPNKHLVTQTIKQAEQFGIDYCEFTTEDFPQSFLDGKSILITSVQKLFNGLTKFGLGSQSLRVGSIVMDDAHACVDAIRNSLQIKIESSAAAYTEIRNLFETSLQNQGLGTYADICNKNADDILPVPYWDWQDKQEEVVNILSKYSSSNAIKFAWELLKNTLKDCQCVISGTSLEIAPYLPPLHLFGSYYKAKHRVFMSATVTNDSFLVKGLGLTHETITKPLVLKNEKWSGEKMILIPSLIDDSLDERAIISKFAESKKRNVGIVALVPSFKKAEAWKVYGATIATKENINAEIETLFEGEYEHPLVIVNRYDGIDLPDRTCRILVFDGKPHTDNLIDRYSEGCRESSDVTAVRIARTIEQGLGRSVRGEKDFCVIIATEASLVKNIRSKETRKHLSNQTRKQIEIGLEIAEMAVEDIQRGNEPFEVLRELINKCLKRDDAWKAFYNQEMNTVLPESIDHSALKLFEAELIAEKKYQEGDIEGAKNTLQKIIDDASTDELDKGWYLQEIARYYYSHEKIESNKFQVTAHKKNRFLMKPRSGMVFKKISIISQKRMENIISWINKFENYEELSINLEDILTSLQFGVKADTFEAALDDLAKALGFVGERPDKEWKEGPDNLWALQDNRYLLIECKSEVDLLRSEINKYESEQMNSSCAWFDRHYQGAQGHKILIIPTRRLANSAAFTDLTVQIMEKRGLERLVSNTRKFFLEFKNKDFKSLSESNVQDLVNTHNLSVDALVTEYTKPFKPYRS